MPNNRCSHQVYGPRQYPEKLVPKFILRALSGQPLPVHGSGEQQRGFVYVDDAAAAFQAIVERGQEVGCLWGDWPAGSSFAFA